jgi:hypothetical protein
MWMLSVGSLATMAMVKVSAVETDSLTGSRVKSTGAGSLLNNRPPSKSGRNTARSMPTVSVSKQTSRCVAATYRTGIPGGAALQRGTVPSPEFS